MWWFAAIALAGAPAAPDGTLTLCDAGQRVLFACADASELASVCAAKGATFEKGRIVLRIGSVGHLDVDGPPGDDRSPLFFLPFDAMTHQTSLQLTAPDGRGWRVVDQQNGAAHALSVDVITGDQTVTRTCHGYSRLSELEKILAAG